MKEKFTVLLGIDVETDVGSFTPFYEGVRNGVPLLLDLLAGFGVKGTFYFTGDAARQNSGIARFTVKSGNEIGYHSLYHETVGDELFPIPGEKPLLPHEVEPRLKIAADWIFEACGVRPVSFRAPRLWGGTPVVNALEKLGYVSDASYPMYFHRKRFVPYYPSRNNWLDEGDGAVLEIPNFADMTMESKDAPLERDRDPWPAFRTEGADVEELKKLIGGLFRLGGEFKTAMEIAADFAGGSFIQSPFKNE
ncbi:MAG: polysaccharide deacetylase family protein [Clostridiales bacterium]|jgi:peptidoglycan/xylan/chitin deacetylase (PgdA/CDA1 family)|nr:polysaccharide deacetylase family protein [Clostridiales bacterium]